MEINWRDPEKELPPDQYLVIIKRKYKDSGKVSVSSDSFNWESMKWSSDFVESNFNVTGWLYFRDLIKDEVSDLSLKDKKLKRCSDERPCINCCLDQGECLGHHKELSFKEASEPLIKWMAENVHPHHVTIVTATGAELLEGEISHQTNEFLVD